jgi:lysophospholipase L1-like esterase
MPPSPHEEPIECGSEAFPMVMPGATIMLIGDSLAVGMEPKFISLARKGGYVPVTHVVNGTSIFQWMKWIRSDLEKNRPELIVVSLGTNDAIIYDRLKQHTGLYGEFVKIVEESGAVIVWLGPPDIAHKRIPHLTETRSFIRKYTSYYFESEVIEKPLGGDGIHSSPTGYNRWMGAAWDWMIEQNILMKSDS